MKQALNPLPITLPQRKAHKAARRKRETWMPRLQEQMFRQFHAGKLFH